MLADLQSVESSLDKAQRLAKSGEKEAKLRAEILAKCQALLAAGKPVRGLMLDTPDAKRVFRGLQLMTSKPVLLCGERG